ncbi:MAG: DEAD/DEAH box helicase family protein [Victivallales bacterium]|jgi:type I site-specific restriction endonuclease
MNEAETRAEHIDPALKAAGWGVVEGSRILREYYITPGRIEGPGKRGKPLKVDYVLVYRNRKLAVNEAKAWDEELTEGVGQSKNYATKMGIRFAYATNGKGIYFIDMETGKECELTRYPTPDELWNMTFASTGSATGNSDGELVEPSATGLTGSGKADSKHVELWRLRFAAVPFEDKGGSHPSRYYQDTAVERVMEAIADNKKRILLTLATGTGKTFIAFQIAWKLFQSRWNLSSTGSETDYIPRRPRILFLADRNNLADQAYNEFSSFPEDALVRIAPDEISKKGKVPKNGSLFFTIFQTFMTSTGSVTGDSDSKFKESSTTGKSYGEPVEPEPFKEVTEIKNAYGYMYILQCSDGSFYVGSTRELKLRIDEHNRGEGSKHTKARMPGKLVYYETFDRIDVAFSREKQVQGWSRAKKIALISGHAEQLPYLSKHSASAKPNGVTVAEPVEAFGEYPPDFFDFIIIDECHRGGANDESNWRGIMEYFAPAVQLGLTATPKRKDNIDTYKYFGDPVYIYSLKEGINDGFLTPFKVKQIATTLDEYVYTPDDKVIEGEIEAKKVYTESDFNKIIEIKEREKKRVKIFMDLINQKEKTLVFCARQDHALAVRDLINQMKTRNRTTASESRPTTVKSGSSSCGNSGTTKRPSPQS